MAGPNPACPELGLEVWGRGLGSTAHTASCVTGDPVTVGLAFGQNSSLLSRVLAALALS